MRYMVSEFVNVADDSPGVVIDAVVGSRRDKDLVAGFGKEQGHKPKPAFYLFQAGRGIKLSFLANASRSSTP